MIIIAIILLFFNSNDLNFYFYDTLLRLVKKTILPSQFYDKYFDLELEQNEVKILIYHINQMQNKVDYQDYYSISGVYIKRKYLDKEEEPIGTSNIRIKTNYKNKIIHTANSSDTSLLLKVIKVNSRYLLLSAARKQFITKKIELPLTKLEFFRFDCSNLRYVFTIGNNMYFQRYISDNRIQILRLKN